MALTDAANLTGFDQAYANEAMARALALAGRLDEARPYLEAARTTPIADPQDREIFEGDLHAEPWYGVVTAPAL
jgi:hypothetical protein